MRSLNNSKLSITVERESEERPQSKLKLRYKDSAPAKSKHNFEEKRQRILDFVQKSEGKKLKIRRAGTLSVSHVRKENIHPPIDFYQNLN